MAYGRRVDFHVFGVISVVTATIFHVFSNLDRDNHPRVSNDVHVLSLHRQHNAVSETKLGLLQNMTSSSSPGQNVTL